MKIKLSDGTDIFFITHGAEQEIVGDKLIEKPTMLFLHGGPGLADHNLYVPFWSSFKDIAQVVFLDFRGHGKSAGWQQEDKFNLRTWAADVKDFCDKLGITKPIVVGFSFGGWVALEYVISYPEHPGALILCNTEAHIDVEKRAQAYGAKAKRKGYSDADAARVAETVRRLGDGSMSSKDTARVYIETCAPLFSENPGGPEEEAIWALCKQNHLAWEVFDRDEQFKFDHRPNLHKIHVPVLSIAGELDVEHPASCAREMCAAMVNAQVEQVVLKGVGDPVDHDDPDGAANAVRNFIMGLT